jgi:hypothetical protein
MRSLMAVPKKGGGSAAEERRNIARALAWIEKRVGDAVGTSADRPGDDVLGNGDPTQMDCVDVATNLTGGGVCPDGHIMRRLLWRASQSSDTPSMAGYWQVAQSRKSSK